MTTRTRHTATYLYPGVFFPEETSRAVAEPTLAAVLDVQPAEEDGYFVRDGWYAVRVRAIVEKRYTDEHDEETWVRKSSEEVASWIVGERIPLTDPRINADTSGALRANLAQYGPHRTTDGVLCRTRNWQPAAEYAHVVTVDELERVRRG